MQWQTRNAEPLNIHTIWPIIRRSTPAKEKHQMDWGASQSTMLDHDNCYNGRRLSFLLARIFERSVFSSSLARTYMLLLIDVCRTVFPFSHTCASFKLPDMAYTNCIIPCFINYVVKSLLLGARLYSTFSKFHAYIHTSNYNAKIIIIVALSCIKTSQSEDQVILKQAKDF